MEQLRYYQESLNDSPTAVEDASEEASVSGAIFDGLLPGIWATGIASAERDGWSVASSPLL